MIVRGVDSQNDWLFGKGKNDYKRARDACAQNIKTRLQSFLGDCFFALEEGLDWFNLNGSKNIAAVTLAVRTTILNTPDVIALKQVDVGLDTETRNLRMTYEVETVYGNIASTETISFSVDSEGFLLWDASSFLTLEDLGLIIL